MVAVLVLVLAVVVVVVGEGVVVIGGVLALMDVHVVVTLTFFDDLNGAAEQTGRSQCDNGFSSFQPFGFLVIENLR